MNKLYSIGIIAFYFSPILLGIIPSVQEKPDEKPIEVKEEVAETAEPPSTQETPLDLNNKDDLKTFARNKVIEKWGEGEWEAFDALIQKESGWNPNAKNPRSTAYGLGQFLRATQRSYGIEGVSDPERQLEATMCYVSDRYGTPSGAWSFHRNNNWY